MKYIDLKNINSIFEGGCGVGAVFKYILSKNINIKISGIDICKEAINKCIENFPMSNVAVKDVCNLDSYDTNSFDSVISVCVLSYLDSLESIKKAVDELIRITKSGCKIAICTFTDTEKGMKSFRQIVPKKWWEKQNFNISFLSVEDIGLEDFPNRYSVFMVKN
jgi:ubiquinone/menaquinone biosynthesis C-methylase UbiE